MYTCTDCTVHRVCTLGGGGGTGAGDVRAGQSWTLVTGHCPAHGVECPGSGSRRPVRSGPGARDGESGGD